jgi:hypothetical protein
MKDIRFVLKDYKTSKATTLSVKYQCEDGVMKYATGHTITVEDFTNKKFSKPLNKKMTSIAAEIDKYVTKMEKAGKPVLRDVLANHLRGIDGKPLKEILSQNPFFIQVQQIIDDAKAGSLPIYNGVNTGGLYTKGTLKHWKLTFTKLKEWNPDLSWDITMDDYNSFVAWANSKGYRPNYTGTIIKMWKVFMTLGMERKHHTCITHLDRRFKKLAVETTKIALDDKQITALRNVPLTGSDKEIRDRFVMNIYLGLRATDMKELKESDYKDGMIHSVNRKTGKTIVIPAHDVVKEIIAEYGGKFPPAYHEYYVNRQIKKIALLAGLSQKETFIETVGGKQVVTTVRICDVISNHTCRRSFFTNNKKNGLSDGDNAKLGGSTIKNMERYNKESAVDLAKRVKDQEAFKKKDEGNEKVNG